MSILIRGMEAPKSCEECNFSAGGYCLAKSLDFLNWCVVNDRPRPSWCPLIELPPHGDLIDRNKLYEKTAEWEAQALHMVAVTMHDEDTTEWRKWSTVLKERGAFKFDVADAPTIIEAEETNK